MQDFLHQCPVGIADKLEDMNSIIYIWRKPKTNNQKWILRKKRQGENPNKIMCFFCFRSSLLLLLTVLPFQSTSLSYGKSGNEQCRRFYIKVCLRRVHNHAFRNKSWNLRKVCIWSLLKRSKGIVYFSSLQSSLLCACKYLPEET